MPFDLAQLRWGADRAHGGAAGASAHSWFQLPRSSPRLRNMMMAYARGTSLRLYRRRPARAGRCGQTRRRAAGELGGRLGRGRRAFEDAAFGTLGSDAFMRCPSGPGSFARGTASSFRSRSAAWCSPGPRTLWPTWFADSVQAALDRAVRCPSVPARLNAVRVSDFHFDLPEDSFAASTRRARIEPHVGNAAWRGRGRSLDTARRDVCALPQLLSPAISSSSNDSRVFSARLFGRRVSARTQASQAEWSRRCWWEEVEPRSGARW